MYRYTLMALATLSNTLGSGAPELEYTGGLEHALNAQVSQGGQAHTSPGAELLAIAIAIEQARWPIHIFSDNQGYVAATQRLLNGEPTAAPQGQLRLMEPYNQAFTRRAKEH